MEQALTNRVITQTAALHIPSIRKAYRRLGVSCRPTSSLMHSTINQLKGLLALQTAVHEPQYGDAT